MISVKMAQIVDDYDQAMSTPEELADQSNRLDLEQDKLDPVLTPPPEDLGNELAKEWQGQMVRVGPDLFMDQKVIDLFSKLKVLGFNLASKDEVLKLSQLFTDSAPLADEVSWLDDSEWAHLIAYLTKVPAKLGSLTMRQIVGQADQMDGLQLIQSLGDISLDVDNLGKLKQILSMLSASAASPFSGVAKSLLTSGDAALSKIINLYDTSVKNKLDDKYKNVKPNVVNTTPAYETIKDSPSVEPKLESDTIQMPQPTPAPAPISMPQPTPPKEDLSESVVDMPNKMQDMYEAYDDYFAAAGSMSGVNVLSLGEESKLRVLPEVKPSGYAKLPEDQKAKQATIPVKGGQLVRSYGAGKNAMVVGEAPDGLAVFTIPQGKYEVWDPINMEVRFSASQPRR